MSHPLLKRAQGRMRRRRIAVLLLMALPMLAAIIAVGMRLAGRTGAVAAGIFAGAVILILVARAIRAVTPRLIVRGLDNAMASIDDSADLLLRDDDPVSTLGMLQRERILARLDVAATPELGPAWPWRWIASSLLTGALIAVAALEWPVPGTPPAVVRPGTAAQETSPTITRIVSAKLDVIPPAYTGQAARQESDLDAEAPEGSQLHWTLQFAPDPKTARLRFLDGAELPLVRKGDAWIAERSLAQSTLYRIGIESAAALPEDRLYRLDMIADQAPEIRVIEPDRTLSQVSSGQQSWSLGFEVNDDHGVGDARLGMILAQGGGEQVSVSERSISLRPEAGGDARHRRYRHRFSLAALGLAAGDDLIVRLQVADNRQPKANIARSASYILRWPPETSAQSEGVEGIVQKVLPAYFRSQRQIIIDTETLIAERPAPQPDRFLSRSDSIGVDQKILRLRYGQFLGEEFESGGSHDSGASTDASEGQHSPSQQDALTAGNEHAGEAEGAAVFGQADEVLAEYGHTHDHAEAATLLDPQTRKILKSALAEMWQAELHLRQGEPHKALPFENRALKFIKQVQQSTRIYLARVGLELPAVDESRRLSGERTGLRDPAGVLLRAQSRDQPLIDLYRSLMANQAVDLDAFDGWVREQENQLPDALGLIAATDAVRRQPDCADCRQRLQDRVWALLPATPAGTTLRSAPAADGNAYLENLDREPQR